MADTRKGAPRLFTTGKKDYDLSGVGKPKHRALRLAYYIRWFDEHLKRRS